MAISTDDNLFDTSLRTQAGPALSPAATTSSTTASLSDASTATPAAVAPPAPSTPLHPVVDALSSVDQSVDHTPLSGNCIRAASMGTMTTEAQRAILRKELKYATVCANAQWVFDLYPETSLPNASNQDIDTFLEGIELYDTKRHVWTKLAALPTPVTESMLYDPFIKIFDVVLHNWGLKETRIAWDVHDKRVPHTEAHPTNTYSKPDFLLTGNDTVLVIQTPRKQDKARYRSTLVVIDAKQESQMASTSEYIPQMAVYARQLFNNQPNRNFVRILVVSEKSVRVLHFDRSGVKYSTCIDIHKQPREFIRILLGVTSKRPDVLGFDSSIVWETDGVIGASGKLRVKGTIKSLRDNKQVTYDIIGHEPSFQCLDLRGRGTTCWNVTTKDGKEDLLVKDSWRSEGREAEHIYLTKAQGLKGVGQMLGFQDLITTASLRGANAITEVGFTNRTKTRMTLERYGPPIYKFNTVLEVLYAFHDAILGHYNLVGKGILHRDVSINNILIGKEGAPEGWRGVLIDLDMAILLKRTAPHADVRTGTRMFQSINVLRSCDPLWDDGLRQTHLDDLESFFYCFCYLIFGFVDRGVMANPCPRTLEEWNREDPRDAHNSKMTFWMMLRKGEAKDRTPEVMSPFWGRRCKLLLFALANYLHPFIDLEHEEIDSNAAPALYKGMAALFRSAIDDIIASQTTPTRKTVPDMTPPRRLGQVGSPLARPSPPSPDHAASPSLAAPSSPSMIPSPLKPASSSRHSTTYESQPTHWAKTRSLPPPPQPQFAATLKRPSDDGSSLFSDRPVAAKKIKSADGSAIPSPPRTPPG